MFDHCLIQGRGVNPAEYHTIKHERGDPQHPVSPSMLKAFTACPARWKAGYQSPESDSKAFGSLLDCRLLTPEQFAGRYAIQPATYKAPESAKKDAPLVDKPWSNNANICKDWCEGQREKGKEIVKAGDIADVDAARTRLLADPILAAWHEACDTQVWVQGEWYDEGTQLTIPVRCLLDYVPRIGTEFAECLGDLKTSASGSLRFFSRNVYAMGYHLQAAFDLALYEEATKEDRRNWVFIGIENFSPWQPFRRMLSPDYIEIGKRSFDTALRYYCKCLKENVWPGYDDNADAVQGWSLVNPDPFMEYESVSNHMLSEVSKELTMEQKLEAAGLGN